MEQKFQTSKWAQNIETIQPPLDSTPVGAKTPDKKTPATESSERKVKSQKEYVPKEPDS